MRVAMIAHRHNQLKTAVMIGALSVVIVVVGTAADGRRGLVIAVVVAAGVSSFGFFYSDRLALRAMHARPVSEVEAPILHRIVRELAAKARQPMPRVYVSPTEAPNAFATGRNPRNAAVCCTRGLMLLLNERELRGVLGHELSHVYNRDILVSSVAGALANAVMWAVNLVWLFPIGRSDDDDGPGILGLLLAMLLGPLAATLIRLAVSRSREYQADLSGARLTNDPLALASALRKLDRGARLLPLAPEPELIAASHLMIISPFRGHGMARLFASHPSTNERIARLEQLAGYRR
jgi:heat shock protein HtpX